MPSRACLLRQPRPFGGGVRQRLGLHARALRRNKHAGAAWRRVKGREVHHERDKADVGSGIGAEAGKFRQGLLKQPDGGGTLDRNREEPGVEGGLVRGHAPAVGCALH